MSVQIVGLFCEDIREEKSDQLTLVGILPDNVDIPPPPTGAARGMIPKLCLYVRIYLDLEDELKEIKVRLAFPGSSAEEIDVGSISEQLIRTSKEQAVANGLPIAGVVHRVVLQQFTFPTAGKITAVVESEQMRRTCAVLNFRTAQTTG
jgi:hypothetical protein